MSENGATNLEEERTQSTGGVFSGTASHTSGSDTMAGVPEMPSSMSMSKSQKHNEKKAPSTPGSTVSDNFI